MRSPGRLRVHRATLLRGRTYESVSRAVRLSEAPSYSQTVMTYDPSSTGAVAYMQVAREIAERGKAFDSNVVSINYKSGDIA